VPAKEVEGFERVGSVGVAPANCNRTEVTAFIDYRSDRKNGTVTRYNDCLPFCLGPYRVTVRKVQCANRCRFCNSVCCNEQQESKDERCPSTTALRAYARDDKLRAYARDDKLRAYARDDKLRAYARDDKLRAYARDDKLRAYAPDDNVARPAS
jgi:hypothetical protein